MASSYARTHASVPARLSAGRLKLTRHVLTLLSSLVGDDPAGKRVRRAVLRAMGATIDPSSDMHGGSFLGNPANLTIGARVFVNRGCYFDLDTAIVLEDDVVIGHGVTIITAAHEIGPTERRAGPISPRSVRVMAGAWVGANATLMPGVTIGRGAVIAACATVTKDVAGNELVAGTPAAFVRSLANNSQHPRANLSGLSEQDPASAPSSPLATATI